MGSGGVEGWQEAGSEVFASYILFWIRKPPTTLDGQTTHRNIGFTLDYLTFEMKSSACAKPI